jgi:hypothetical protein
VSGNLTPRLGKHKLSSIAFDRRRNAGIELFPLPPGEGGRRPALPTAGAGRVKGQAAFPGVQVSRTITLTF